jgi:hypothetical protein
MTRQYTLRMVTGAVIGAVIWLYVSAATFATTPCGVCPPPSPTASKLGPRRFGPVPPEMDLDEYSREPLIAVGGVPIWNNDGAGTPATFPLWDSYYPYAGFSGPYVGWSYRSFYYPFYGPWSYSYGPRWYFFNRGPWIGGPWRGPYYYWRGPWWGPRRFF